MKKKDAFQFRVRRFLRTRLTREFLSLIKKFVVAILLIACIIVIEGVALWWFTPQPNAIVSKPIDGIYHIVVSIFGETMAPSGAGARAMTLIGLFQGLVLGTYLIAISAYFTIQGGRVMTRTFANHIVLCGWNFQGLRIIEELLNAGGDTSFDVVVVPGDTDKFRPEQFASKIFVVAGPPTDEQTLIDANIMEAKSVIVLADTNLPPDVADAQALMITLAVETMNSDVYTCVQLMRSANAVHLERANVDEVIPFDLLGANLAVASALNPGITRVISELVHFDDGSEMRKVMHPLPSMFIGQSFREVAAWFVEHDMILIGVESAGLQDSYGASDEGTRPVGQRKVGDRGVSVNPKNYIIREQDDLFVISDDDPVLS
jgi:voltage-gated potassium channel